MSRTGRSLRWILAIILSCAGCAVPLWQELPGRGRTQPEADAAPILAAAATESATPVVSRPADATDAPADDAARRDGLPEPEAARLAEIFLGAYAEMYRQAARSATESAAETSSPTYTLPDGTVTTVAASQAGDSASSVATASHALRERAANSPPPETAGSNPVTAPRPRGDRGLDQEPSGPAAPAPPSDTVNADAESGDDVSGSVDAGPHAAPEGSSMASDSAVASEFQVSWQRQVRLAIERLQDELQSETLDEQQRARGQACLSLLHLAAEDPEKALETLQDFDDQQLEFWRQTVLGLGVLLDPEELPKLRYRVAVVSDHFQQGISALATLGPLRLANVAFCTKVDGFGDYAECNSYGLEAGKPVLLYVEVENFTAELIQPESGQDVWARDSSRRNGRAAASPPRYATELHARYEILDVDQRTVVSRTLPVGSDICRNRRRDYYISYVLYMPENIVPGAYTLELTIEDKKGGKFGNAVVDFRIK